MSPAERSDILDELGLLFRVTLCAETEITLRAELVKKFP
jgi:hypothetical protein